MIRIIALDLDGTLLDSRKGLSPRNCRALEKAAEKGVHIVPTTGRFFGMMPECVRQLGFVRYAITVNGAAVFDRERDETVLREEIPLDMALGVIDALDRHDVIYDCYRNDWGWMNSAFIEKAGLYATDVHYLDMVRRFRNPVENLHEHLESTRAEGDVQKVMMFSRVDDPTAAELSAVRGTIAAEFPRIRVTASTWNNLELNIETAHKGNTLRRFAESLGYGLGECMAIGDGLNDLTMVESARYGVAMANAAEEVKRKAASLTLSNDEDGVAAAIEKAMAEGLI